MSHGSSVDSDTQIDNVNQEATEHADQISASGRKDQLHRRPWGIARGVSAVARFLRRGHSEERVGEPHLPQQPARSAVADLPRGMQVERCGLTPTLVSVVLPVYNQADLIAESIESVLAQSYSNFELIVVNDGSTDDVEAVLQRYLQHPKVRIYKQSNQELPKALSNGFSYARGEYWTWTSADNVMEPRMLECLVNKLSACPDLGMVYADYYAIDDSGEILQDDNWRPHNRPDPESGEIRLPHQTTELNVVQDNFIGPCFMYRGWIGQLIGDYDPQLGVEDYDYWMRINALFSIEHVGTKDILYRYRVHENTLSAFAHEHRILEKVRRLMDYEKERAESYESPLVFIADAAGEKWLLNLGFEASLIRPFNGTATIDDGAADVADGFVISSETAEQHLANLADPGLPFAILWDDGDTRQLALQRILNQNNCLSFVKDEATATRIRLVAGCPMLDADSKSALAGILAFSKNQRFFHATRSSQELKRCLPKQVVQPNGRHVLIQVDSFTQGGMEHVVIDLSVSLEEVGYRVTILNQGEEGDAAKKAREHGLRIVSSNFKTTNEYGRFLIAEGIDLVNAHYSIYGASKCKTLSIPFIETIHNSYVWLNPPDITAYRDADAHIENYICVSKTVARYSDLVLGLDAKKMHVVRNGINANNIGSLDVTDHRKQLREKWGVDESAPVFLNVASIMATKAQLPLVNAFSHVTKTHPDAKLVLLGNESMEPTYHQAIVKAIDSLGLSSNVVLAGYQRNVASYYSAADVFVLPSFWEGWSLSLGEAVSNGLPCVITNVGSAYEFEDIKNVFIVDPPFRDTTELNFETIGRYVYGEDQNFEARLAQSMLLAAASQRYEKNQALAEELDCTHAYRAYATLFSDVMNQSQTNQVSDQI